MPRRSQRLQFNREQLNDFDDLLTQIRDEIDPAMKQPISRKSADTYSMLMCGKGHKGRQRRDHLRLVHKCLKLLVLYGRITCNVDIGVAGRNQSILQTIDGVMSLFSMMVKPPRDTTEATEVVLMAAQFVFTIFTLHLEVLGNAPKTLAFMFLSGRESEVPKKISMGSTIMETLRTDCGYMERLAARTSMHTRHSGFAAIDGGTGAGCYYRWFGDFLIWLLYLEGLRPVYV
jgi:hypothetical protein